MITSRSHGVKMCLSLSPLYGVLIVILTSPLFGVFSRGSLVKEMAANRGKASSKYGCMAPSTSRKKDLGVVTSLVTTERAQVSFFR